MGNNRGKRKEMAIGLMGLSCLYACLSVIAEKHNESVGTVGGNQSRSGAETDFPLRSLSGAERGSFYETIVKPLLDKMLSFAGLIALAPFGAVIAAVIYLHDPGPVFFTQKRVGKDKKLFYLHKFRTMRMDTPHDVPTHQLEHPEQYITKPGRFLRKHSLDELPQIWDIFRGKMSVVGPRPALWNQTDLIEEREAYGANSVMPGLTGWAQLNGRDELTIPDKAELDGVYCRMLRKGGIKAFLFDARCFARTFQSVADGRGVAEGDTKFRVNQSEAGFEEYGHLKSFHIDKHVPRRVLITGAGSYVGEAFRNYASSHYPSLTVDTADMLDPASRQSHFSEYDTVFHVAGIAHADIGKADEKTRQNYYAVNRDLAVEAAKAAKASGVRQFVFMSSMIIYGESYPYKRQRMIDEYTLPCPANFYGDSKWQADKEIRKLGSKDFAVAVLRPPMIYGCGCKGNYPALRRLARALPVFPDADNCRSMLYIDNLCEFLCLLILSGESGVYFPQNEEYSSTAKLARAIKREAGRELTLSSLLTAAVAIGSHIPGKTGRLVKKAFGNNAYSQTLSVYRGLEYRVCSLEDSIRASEGKEICKGQQAGPGLVSVITPAYNCAGTIGETIESVRKQTYQNWEMLIVDDASTDHTAEVVGEYARLDPRIRLFSLEHNSGSAAARNLAIANAGGRWIAFLDSDDLWKPQKLEKQTEFMMKHGFAFTFTSYETFKSSADLKRRVFRAPYSVRYRQYLRNTIIGNLTVMMDRSKIGEIHVESGYLEDVLTWMHYLKLGYTAYGLDENLASYRVAGNSKSGNKLNNAKRYYHCLREVQKLSAAESLIYEACYLANAIKKRMFGSSAVYKEEE